jgi:hypothetical protein
MILKLKWRIPVAYLLTEALPRIVKVTKQAVLLFLSK